MRQKDADGIANSVDPDQTAPLAVWSGSALFSQTYLSENLGSLRYWFSPENVQTVHCKFVQLQKGLHDQMVGTPIFRT